MIEKCYHDKCMCVPYKRVRRKQVSIFVCRLAIQLSLSVFIISIFSLFTTHSVFLGNKVISNSQVKHKTNIFIYIVCWNEEEESIEKCERMIWMYCQMYTMIRSRMTSIFSRDVNRKNLRAYNMCSRQCLTNESKYWTTTTQAMTFC